jgi:pyrimidine-nucleoside phosphorylase
MLIMRMFDIIAKKRDGERISPQELEFFIKGYTEGSIPDYQAAAFLMAVYLKGLDNDETAELTRLMAESGEKLDLSAIRGVKVDKHSTGGVGDKTTLVIAPIVAACGVPMFKMSGRALGYTGGTIDKLESIKGFRTENSIQEAIEIVKKIGVSISSQTERIALADKKLYALRDVTATVDSIPLIASSIMSKKIASGSDKVLLDVKTGRGAFVKDIGESIKLAELMVDIGVKSGVETAAYITDMNMPLGNCIGNSVEVVEAIETLKGRGPKDLQALALEMSAKLLEMAGLGNMDECREMAKESLLGKKAIDKFAEFIERHGGDPGIIENYSLLGEAEFAVEINSDDEGYIEEVKADMIGKASVLLGAGRDTKESVIDHTAGIILNVKPGTKVAKNELLATILANDKTRLDEAVRLVRKSFVLSFRKPPVRPVILAYVDSENVRRYAD